MDKTDLEKANFLVKKSKESYNLKEIDKSIRLLEKSLRICSTREAELLLAKYIHIKKSGYPNDAKRTLDKKISGVRPKVEKKNYVYKEDDLRIVNVILKKKGHYEVLGCTKNSTIEEIKKSYKTLAFKLHPDRNKAPGAENAFKKLTAANNCLSNVKTRQHYDMTGEEVPGQRSTHRYHQEYFTQDELFNSFFANFAGQRYTQRNSRARQQTRAQQNPYVQLLQFLPIFLLFAFSLFSSSGSNNGGNTNSTFSLDKEGQFRYIRTTQHAGIDYFVNVYFQQQYGRYPRTLYSIEKQVENLYVIRLKKDCRSEKLAYKGLEQKIKKSPNEDLVDKLENWKYVSCEKLKDFRFHNI